MLDKHQERRWVTQDPTVCEHVSACRTFEVLPNGGSVFGYGCRDCGMKIMAGTWEDARAIFWLRDEKAKVRRLVQRRTNGETLTERERLMIGHSPFGDGCPHNF